MSQLLYLMAQDVPVPDSVWFNAIDRFGFPLVICVVLGWVLWKMGGYFKKKDEERDIAYKNLLELHSQLLVRTTVAVEQGNSKMTHLIDVLEKRPCLLGDHGKKSG